MKAIDILEYKLRDYISSEVHQTCEYYIYSNLIDITDEAISGLEALQTKLDSLGEYCEEQIGGCETQVENFCRCDMEKELWEFKQEAYQDILEKLRS